MHLAGERDVSHHALLADLQRVAAPVRRAAVHSGRNHFVSAFMSQEDIHFHAAEGTSYIVDDAIHLLGSLLELEKALDQLLLPHRRRRETSDRRSRSCSHCGHSWIEPSQRERRSPSAFHDASRRGKMPFVLPSRSIQVRAKQRAFCIMKKSHEIPSDPLRS